MTLQAMDSIYFKGNTYGLLSTPLSSHPDAKQIEMDLSRSTTISHSACWRGYIAEWAIVDEKLYLVDILNMNHISDYEKIFGTKPIIASWVNEKIEILIDGTHPYNRTSDSYTKTIIIRVCDGKVFGIQEKEVGPDNLDN